MFRLRARQKGLTLTVEGLTDAPRIVQTDEVKLWQVLINLLNNAIKFTHTGGVTVRVTSLHPSPNFGAGAREGLTGDGGIRLRFDVEDTGAGIAPEELDHLFTPFVQTDAGRSAQEGTGLGLPISRAFAQLMGAILLSSAAPDRVRPLP